MAIKDVHNSAKWAKEIWLEKIKICPELKQYFHVRPCSDKVTLVTTHESRKLNGLAGLSESGPKKGLEHILSKIIADNPTPNNIERILDGLGFARNNKPEHAEQRELINAMLQNKLILPGLTTENLCFIGSEVILSEKKEDVERIDIVACDSKNLYFLELKTGDNKNDDPVEQVKNYINKYRNKPDFFELLNNYPVNIDNKTCFIMGVTPIIGVVVKGFNIKSTPKRAMKKDIYEYDYTSQL